MLYVVLQARPCLSRVRQQCPPLAFAKETRRHDCMSCSQLHEFVLSSFDDKQSAKPRACRFPSVIPQLKAAEEHDHGQTISVTQHHQFNQDLLSSSDRDVLYDIPNNETHVRHLCNHGQLGCAVDVLSQIDRAVSTGTYMSLLKACHKSKLFTAAKHVYEHLTRHNAQLSGFLGDYLVVTLAKCGAIEEAHSVFWALCKRTVFSWTAIISAHAFYGCAEDALKMHQSMLDDGVEPNGYTFVILLKACGIVQNLEQGKQLHAEVRRRGMISDVFVGSTLISMYGKCGDITEAELVFTALSQHNIVTWNSMLQAYVEQDQGKEALQSYRQMQEEGVGSDQHTFLFALQACTFLIEQEKSLSTERRPTMLMSFEVVQSLHVDAQRTGFLSNVFVGTTFVSMYGKIGAIAEAEYVFGLLSQHNVVSWTAMLSAYVEHAAAEKALQLYRQMQVEGLSPDRQAAVSALQACCTLAEDKGLAARGRFNKAVALEIGHAVSADTRSKDSEVDVVFGTALLSMYGKCGALVEAELTFAAMSQRNVVSWNAMLSLFVEECKMEEALQLYRQMQMEGMSPDQQTIVFALQAVCFLADSEGIFTAKGESEKASSLEIGRALHFDAQRKAVLSDVFVGNTLVSMYGKCSAVVEAEQMFLAMARRNVVSWTAMLSAYFEQGRALEALQLYVLMSREGVTPDHLTSVIVLQACGALAEKEDLAVNGLSSKAIAMEIGRALHDDMRRVNLEANAFVGTALLSMYGKCGATLEAENVFMALVEPDAIAWSAMLSAYVDQKEGEKALLLYRQMQQEGVQSDHLTSVIVLQACSILEEKEKPLQLMGNSPKATSLEIGCALHANAHKEGFAYDLIVGNTILNLYGKCGAVVEAEHVFEALSFRNIVSWNAMISAYAEQGQEEKALLLYSEMQKHGVTKDDLTLIFVLKACCALGCLEICNWLLFDIVCASYEAVPSLTASLIHAYGSCASMRDAYAVFNELPEARLASWNACITTYAGEGDWIASLHMFEALRLVGIKPDRVTFTSAMSACSRTGLVVKGLHYFVSMSEDHSSSPEVKHYGSMLDALARAGDFKRVKDMLAMMPLEADETIWLCLLGACQMHGNIDLAEHAFNYASNIQPNHAAAYVAMSNVYANAGLHDGEDEVV